MIIFVFDRVENIVGKGEIACTSNFSFFPQCFQKASFLEASKGVIFWKWVNDLKQKAFGKNIMGRGETGGNLYFLPITDTCCFSYIKTAVCKCFQFGQARTLVVW